MPCPDASSRRRRTAGVLFALALHAAAPAAAQAPAPALPALHDVTGVAADDVLNVRAAPDAGAAIVATLPPDRRNVEVTALSPDGRWAQVGLGERSGWAARRYLAAQPPRPADRLPAPLRCHGTEPFWGLWVPGDGSAEYERLPEPERQMRVVTETVPLGRLGEIAARLADDAGDATLFLRREACDDTMSDRAFGLSVRLLLTGPDGPVAHVGCCTLTGP